jgi:DNA invertase Pin-like site-specific DNA recombinase
MKVGYARTSTIEQKAGFDAQIVELKGCGAEKIFSEQVSSVAQREQLTRAIDFCREGDTLIVTKLDRLARSITHLSEIMAELKRKNVELCIINLGIDTSTATGKLMLNVIGSVAQFEREMMLERQREGIAKAKGEGKYKGRVPTARAKADEAKALLASGVKPTEVARQLKIGRTSLYRITAEGKGAQ